MVRCLADGLARRVFRSRACVRDKLTDVSRAVRCAGGYAATKGIAHAAKETAIAVDKAGHQALEKAKAYEQKKAIAACHKAGAKQHGGKRRASLSVALVDGVAVPVPTPGGAVASVPEGMELKVIDGIPVAMSAVVEAPPVGTVEFQADDV